MRGDRRKQSIVLLSLAKGFLSLAVDHENPNNMMSDQYSAAPTDHRADAGSRTINAAEDFEQLDKFSLHEQPEAEELEECVEQPIATVPADRNNDYKDDLLLNFGDAGQNDDDDDAGAQPPFSGLHSTARPLHVTGDPACQVPIPVAATADDQMIHLTPDGDDGGRGPAPEPFVNVETHRPPIDLSAVSRSDNDRSPSPPPAGDVHLQAEPDRGRCTDFAADDDTCRSCPFINSSAWLRADNLDPRVESLIYWRDPKKSGAVFGSGLVLLLSLTCFSLIGVVSYLLLAVMLGTLSYRIYKNVMQAVQKTGDGHPFKAYLEFDLSLPRERVHESAEVIAKHAECTAVKLRRLFLVEDLVDSLKFAVMLWLGTYLGAWFNGLTLFTLGYISVFTLPKVYETYKVEIDRYAGIACTQIGDVVSKVKAKIPVLKKQKEQ